MKSGPASQQPRVDVIQSPQAPWQASSAALRELAESARMVRRQVEQDTDTPIAEILDGIEAAIGELYPIVGDGAGNMLFNRLNVLSATDPALACELGNRAELLGIMLEPLGGLAAPAPPR